jgi:hypothetical protein
LPAEAFSTGCRALSDVAQQHFVTFAEEITNFNSRAVDALNREYEHFIDPETPYSYRKNLIEKYACGIVKNQNCTMKHGNVVGEELTDFAELNDIHNTGDGFGSHVSGSGRLNTTGVAVLLRDSAAYNRLTTNPYARVDASLDFDFYKDRFDQWCDCIEALDDKNLAVLCMLFHRRDSGSLSLSASTALGELFREYADQDLKRVVAFMLRYPEGISYIASVAEIAEEVYS